MNKGIGTWAADTYKRVQEATHQAVAPSALEDLVRNTERLARQIEQMK